MSVTIESRNRFLASIAITLPFLCFLFGSAITAYAMTPQAQSEHVIAEPSAVVIIVDGKHKTITLPAGATIRVTIPAAKPKAPKGDVT